MNYKSFTLILIASSVFSACSEKGSIVSAQSSNKLPIIGGSITKEIIIRTNNQTLSSTSGIIAGNISTTVNVQTDDGDQKQVIVEALE